MDLLWIVFNCFVTLVIIKLIQRHLKRRKLPPGPMGIPIFGYLPFMNCNKLNEELFEMRHKYGSLFSMKMGTQDVVILNDYKTIKAGLSKQELSGRPSQFPFDHAHKGNYGIGFCNAEQWREQRRFTLKQLRDAGIGKSRFEERILEEVLGAVELINKDAADTNTPVDITTYLSASVYNSLSGVISGKKYDLKDPWFMKMSDAIASLNEELFRLSSLLTFFPFLYKIFPLKWFMTDAFDNSINTIDATGMKYIEEHKAVFDENNLKDFIDVYLREIKTQQASPNPKPSYSETQLQAIIADFFYAGFDTVTSSLCWGIFLLAAYPEVQKKVQEEVDSIVGRHRAPSVNDRPNLPYSDATIAEIQRCGSIAPLALLHMTEADCELQGYVIPKGTLVIPNLYASHFDPKLWKDPAAFDPTHFLTESGKFIADKEGWVPFSSGLHLYVHTVETLGEQFTWTIEDVHTIMRSKDAWHNFNRRNFRAVLYEKEYHEQYYQHRFLSYLGKRMCVGEAIARMEMFHFIVGFLQKFTFTLEPGTSREIEPAPHRASFRGPPDFKVIISTRK